MHTDAYRLKADEDNSDDVGRAVPGGARILSRPRRKPPAAGPCVNWSTRLHVLRRLQLPLAQVILDELDGPIPFGILVLLILFSVCIGVYRWFQLLLF
jgi:hypothetical protein